MHPEVNSIFFQKRRARTASFPIIQQSQAMLHFACSVIVWNETLLG